MAFNLKLISHCPIDQLKSFSALLCTSTTSFCHGNTEMFVGLAKNVWEWWQYPGVRQRGCPLTKADLVQLKILPLFFQNAAEFFSFFFCQNTCSILGLLPEDLILFYSLIGKTVCLCVCVCCQNQDSEKAPSELNLAIN